jgi:hypothetical protein
MTFLLGVPIYNRDGFEELSELHKSLCLIAGLILASTGALADPPAKKPLYPPPEQSSTVGVFGAHHSSEQKTRDNSQPPPVAAAPETYKVETEEPTSLPAAPHDYVQSDQPVGGGDSSAIARPPAPPPTGFLPDHPMVSGFIAGLIGSDLGSRLYGGAMVGDRSAAGIGYALRIAVILGFAFLLFRFIGRRAWHGSDERLVAPKGVRRDPSFGRTEVRVDGRREPHFGERH